MMKFAEKIVTVVLLVLVSLSAEDISGVKKPIKPNQARSSNAAKNINGFSEPMKMAFFPLKKCNAAVFRAKIKPFTDIDTRVISLRNNNTLVVMARPGTLERIQKVFDNIESSEPNRVIAVKLQNTSVEDVYANMYSISKLLFSDEITSEKVDILKSSATNSLIFIGKKRNIDQLLKHLKLLDVKAVSNFKKKPKALSTSNKIEVKN